MTEQEIRESVERAPYTYASAMQQLLGGEWRIEAGWFVKTNRVEIDAKKFEIIWLDLAPDGEPREQRTIKMPMYASIGATIEVARALAELSNRE